MANEYSVEDLLDFLEHASDKGLMPAATATALAVATRNVLGVLDGAERTDIRQLDLDGVVKRFTNKRARDFNPSSLKEYGRRVRRATELFLAWRNDPANFTVKTRASSAPRRKDRPGATEMSKRVPEQRDVPVTASGDDGSYQSSFPIRPGFVVTISNLPEDLTEGEGERLATFVRMLVMDRKA